MHILYLCNEYPPYPHGGIGTFVQSMGRHLASGGHKVSVLGLYRIGDLKRENDQGVNVYRIPGKPGSKLQPLFDHRKLLRFIWKLHALNAIDLIEGSELSFGLFPRQLPGRKIIRMHGGHHFFSTLLGQRMRMLTRLIEKRSFANADHFCAVSYFAAEHTRKLMHLGNRSIEILPNPVDTQLFRPYPEVPEQDGLIVFTGGLREKKGVHELVQAMPKVVEKHPTAHLYIHGSDTRDRITGQSFLEKLKNEMPSAAASHIEFRGPVPHTELPRINACANVLVYPSWMETQGIVVIEGMANGKAVVASRTGPGLELIEDGHDGLLCDPHSPDSIAEKILLFLKDPALRKKLGDNARKKAQADFSTDVLLPKNQEFYKSCLANA